MVSPKNKKQKTFFLIFMFLILPMVIQAQDIYYVDVDASGSENGLSWANAFTSLQDGLDIATADDEIWVAEGTYYPSVTADRDSTFTLVFRAYLYGGFNGTETSLDQRNLAVHETILSGDLQQNDPDISDNAYHVVTGGSSPSLIDGFTITAGNANGTAPDNFGGGFYLSNSITVRNCMIINNNAEYGGGIFSANTESLIKNCIFLNNTSSSDGGVIFSSGGAGLKLYNCSFSNNSATGNGDAIYTDVPIYLVNCILWGTTDQIYTEGGANAAVTFSDIQTSTGDPFSDGGGNDSDNIEEDPLFTNASSNLILQIESPCLGTGTPVDHPDTEIPYTDILGNPRPRPASADSIDMGAYEQHDENASLPVELYVFSASYENGWIVLSWRTESEVDHRGFILERKESNASYQEIASYLTHDELKSQGNTSSSTEYEFIDQEVFPGTTYYYRLSDVSTRGEVTTHPALSITLDAPPPETILDNAYPNPFNPQTYIGYHLTEKTEVNLIVLDMLGRKVKNLYKGLQSAGNYQVYWNGKDDSDQQCPSGMYIIQLQTAATTKAQKVMLLK